MAEKILKRPKPVVLVVLDGWGVTQAFSGNGITQANTPVMKGLLAKYPSMTLMASGEAVGLPWGESGNSEVGHINMGMGRILYQDLPRINNAISDGSFYQNAVLLKVADHVKKNNSKLHFVGLLSNGCVHSSLEHLQALLIFAKDNGITDVYIHVILDGRDTQFNAGLDFIMNMERFIKEYGVGKIATISGRFYAMDRDNHWERIGKTYAAMVKGEGNKNDDAETAVDESYAKKIYDEEFVPTVITEDGKPVATVADNDAIVFYNYRADRARQLTKAFVLPGFDKFPRPEYLKNLLFACFTEYEANLPVEVVFGNDQIKNTLGVILAANGMKQLRIAETEKYAHVTYFFNGGQEAKSEGEDHELVPSPRVASYDMKPEMSAVELTDRVLAHIDLDFYDFILMNYANADMVGHTGNLEAVIKAVETLDKCLGRLTTAVLMKDGVVLITADHGNAEQVFNMQTGTIDKEHTANPVPLIVVGSQFEGKKLSGPDAPGGDLSLIAPQGILSDLAPTILYIMGFPKPPEMTGRSLVDPAS